MSGLATPLVRVVGDKTATALAHTLDLHTVGDLLRHYPRRYAERGQLTDLAKLETGEHVTVIGRVKSAELRPSRGRGKVSVLSVRVTDGPHEIALTFFNQGWRLRELRAGRTGLFSGKVEMFRTTRQLTNPDYVLFDTEDADADVTAIEQFADSFIPVYPASAALPSWRIAQCLRVVLDTLEPVPDPLPGALLQHQGLIALDPALRQIHAPQSRVAIQAAEDRLRWEEAFVLQVLLAQRRYVARTLPATPRQALGPGLLAAFDARLPFDLTAGQRSVGQEIEADLARTYPMNRLLQGEVGSGKTVVALRAMLRVVDAGGQAALLAPTEVLAQQHLRTIRAMLGPLGEGGLLGGADQGTQVALLTGSLPTPARRRALLAAASGDAGIVVGTHALLQDTVGFQDLGLVVVDEQHRFGVEQRDALRAKSVNPPHVLVMTATPIPRTVAMTVFGDLEVSVLTEVPAGRSPVRTHVVPAGEKPHFLDRAWTRVREEVEAGRQAYVVCPRIGEDAAEVPSGDEPEGSLGPRPPVALLDIAPLLRDGPLQGLRVEQLHGRMAADDKESTMTRFGAGEIDVLLATTVIEVGVDVANATVMVVMDADRFGVSQLHQLRGRVGRGTAPGLCLLVTDAPAGSPARERLEAVAATTDGFELSTLDLQARREGDVLGASQSGSKSSLRLLSVLRDEQVIAAAREAAVSLVEDDSALRTHPLLLEAIGELVDPDRAEFLEKA